MKIIKHLTFTALAATLLFQTSITRADDHGQRGGDNDRGHRDHRDAIITWTKHVTAFLPPGGEIFATIAGTAEGDIGDGTLVGEAFNPRVVLTPTSVTFEADYHFIGSKHSLTVHFRTVQGPDPSGVIRGVITGFVKDGWLKGNVVVGEYTGYACDQGVAGVCFDGTFVVKRGSKAKDRDHRNANITWTKWITLPFPPPSGSFANLEGIVGGDVGDGTFIGETFTAVLQPDGVTTIADAEYHFHGSKHSFTAHIQAVQTRSDNGGVITVSGVITGVVTDGWLKGNVVVGEYTRYACPQGANGFCFDGTLEIKRGSKHGHDDDDDDDCE